MSEQLKMVLEFFKNAKERPFVTALSVALPWVEFWSKIELISHYYFPTVYVAASIFSIMAVLGSVAFIKGVKAQYVRKRWLKILLVISVLSLVCLVALNSAVGVYFFPEPFWVVVIRTLWQIVYVVFFAGTFAFITVAISLHHE